MYFRQFWQDKRLEFERRPNLENLVVGAEYINQIWTPDTFFVNEKTAYFHVATTENQFLRILHDGKVLRSIRWVLRCPTIFPCVSLRDACISTSLSVKEPSLMFRCLVATITSSPHIRMIIEIICFPLRHSDVPASITTEWLLWMLSSN